MNLKDMLTVVIPTSPIPSHPSTAIIDETIASVRSHLPDVHILIQVDGLRSEQNNFSEQYREYCNGLCSRYMKNAWGDISLHFFDGFRHQAAMMKETIDDIKTPLMLYLEHDTPLCEDKVIEWEGICADVVTGNVNSIRLHHYDLGYIHPEHEYLMLPKRNLHVPVIPTVQWSQRAHVATVDFYRRVLNHFSADARTMIEDHMYSVIMNEVARRGKEATWEYWRLAIYSPEGHIKRSRDLNGRAGGPKFEETFNA